MTQRYLPNAPLKLLKEDHPQQHLIHSLQTIIRDYPPQGSYSPHDGHGLYSGPTSIAYLFLQLSNTYPDLIIRGHHLKSWCKAYMSGKRHAAEITVDKCGIINEELAGCAVLAALTGHDEYINVLDYHASIIAQEPHGSDEWLYGRAGFLYLLRMVRQCVPSSEEAMNACIRKLGDRILEHGPSWRWHGKEYLGAVHGSVGIITQLILSDSGYAVHPRVITTLEKLLQSQDTEGGGNFPSSIDSGRHSLVQFCHGAPGFVLSLPLIQGCFDSTSQAAIDDVLAKARACIWEKGLLTKEPNLCHGVTGNALALNSPQREHFMAFATAEMIAKGKKEGWYIEGSDPYGLFCGEAGRAWGWVVLDVGRDMGIIGYSDV
ncbi:MAG: hypothetical protein L6R40_000852 [Gallowayella cf. fulva]|nr:MAG: hypothetical protein L6R40_000852 [Xanthomendoza cf. fulva]